MFAEMDDIETIPDQNTDRENPLKKWLSEYEANTLTSFVIAQFIQNQVSILNLSHETDTAKAAVFDVLEQFICGDNPNAIFERLKAEDSVPSVCGRVFKMGEPTYSCRECGLDPTCVLCVSCFKQSAHRNHKYKMGTSGGGGCCDCGDKEAWKQDPSCEKHILGTEAKNESSVITERMRKFCELVFEAVMQYCVRTLEIESDSNLERLSNDPSDDTFCTVLYNDETHTFEQVIQTLVRTVSCAQKDAIEYVTSIDREGRAVVRTASFSSCLKLKAEIEKQAMRTTLNTKLLPLKVAVLHESAIDHQQFAIEMLAWFQELLTRHAIFRAIFCEVATRVTGFNINHVLIYDFKLWKTARTSWHRLLISGMLMEYENKKKLAIMFTKVYATIMQDFIRDDHDHSFSIVSLGVQLFTVPTISHHLIAHESAFFKLMHTFFAESVDKYVQKKVLQFAKNTANLTVFKRTGFILFDIRYLLSVKPDTWTDDLRMGFLHGVQIMIRLLKVMQGMDAVYRQTGQHMEYEPEWESAFSLHTKLAPVITQVIEWCGTDKIVLVKVYRMILAALAENEFIVAQAKNEVRELADHSTSCFIYDVASRHVSVHLPLSRFFAGLYLHLEKFDLSFDTISSTSGKITPEQIIEPVLCTQTMVAQVYAGMWRRNGYSLLNQLYFYRNVKCRSEMLDRDITLLQIGASLIESNEFMIHTLNKFNLINWAAADYEITSMSNPEEDGIRQIINMVDEFLELFIVLIGERYVPGVGVCTEEDRIKKEIIQQLCIKPFPHSELNKTLPEGQHKLSLENVIDEVATFVKPTHPDRKGVYKLKPAYTGDYNMFYYHYSKEEKSKSEETQRKVRIAKGELVCSPPPQLPKLTESFSMIANLLQCDVMLSIMQTVLNRALDLKARSFTDSHLQKILYLIGYAIQEEESNNYPFLTFHERSSKWGLLALMENLSSSPRVKAHRDLIVWTIRKYNELKPAAASAAADPMAIALEEAETTKTAAAAEKAEREERAKLAAQRREKIMMQMACAQKNFMTSNAELFKEKEGSGDGTQSMEWTETKIETEPESSDAANVASVADTKCASSSSTSTAVESERHTCILCWEDSTVGHDSPCMVYSAFVQKSRVLYGCKAETFYPHVGSCGHVMHVTCWKEFFKNEAQKESRRPYRNRSPGSFDIDKREFLCPLCRCLNNAVLPLSPSLSAIAISSKATTLSEPTAPFTFPEWLHVMKWYTQMLLHATTTTGIATANIDAVVEELGYTAAKMHALCPPIKPDLSAEHITVLGMFNTSICGATPADRLTENTLSVPVTHNDLNSFLGIWIATAYTLETIETLLRVNRKPLRGQLSIRHTTCLSGLTRVAALISLALTGENRLRFFEKMPNSWAPIFAGPMRQLESLNTIELLVNLVFLTPAAIYQWRTSDDRLFGVPSGTELDRYSVELVFWVHVCKIIDSGIMQPEQEQEEQQQQQQIDDEEVDNSSNIMDTQCDTEVGGDGNGNNLAMFYQKCKHTTRTVTVEHVAAEIRRACRPFLRAACLLFHFITEIDFPEEFETYEGDTFELMCTYLGLPSDVEHYAANTNFVTVAALVFGDLSTIGDAASACAIAPAVVVGGDTATTAATAGTIEMSKNTNTNIGATAASIALDKPIGLQQEPAQLIALPDDYSDLINSVSLFTCPNNYRDDSRNPTMCLVCGEILCSQTYCCQSEIDKVMVGACTSHAQCRGAGIGLFLRIRECEILVLGFNKGCFVSAPYLDEYGETDQGLRRGNPLRLCKERYTKLHNMWLGHALHEEIARATESKTHTGAPWHHL